MFVILPRLCVDRLFDVSSVLHLHARARETLELAKKLDPPTSPLPPRDSHQTSFDSLHPSPTPFTNNAARTRKAPEARRVQGRAARRRSKCSIAKEEILQAAGTRQPVFGSLIDIVRGRQIDRQV
jgi:hypothetical protein